DKIRILRNNKGFSQEYVAEQLSVNQSTLTRIEQGKAKLNPDMIPTLCRLFDIEIEELFCSDKVTISNNNFSDQSSGYVNQLIIGQKEAYERQIESLNQEIEHLRKQNV
ncbi:helix-turn-helix transcriptional regulator, partial [Arthrospira platensis SPKY1]|nr:helix-turn-helix transcriptional regulator [Arthrospira platensis SPKY1]